MSVITDAIIKFLQSITDQPILIVLLSAMIPLIELKGAIPVGVSLGMNIWQSAGVAYLGSTLIVIPIFFLLIPIFALLKKIPFIRVFIAKLEAMLKGKAEKMAKKSEGNGEKVARRILMIGLFIFVAIPLPVTGVWTGSAIAVFLGMKFKDSVLPLASGNLVAGTLVTLLIVLVGEANANLVLNIVLILAIIMLVVTIVKIAISKPESIEEETSARETENEGEN